MLLKILIIYANSGAGHRRAAEALFQEVTAGFPGAQIEIFDVLDYTTPFFGRNYPRLYLFLVNYWPQLWGLGWYFFNLDWVDRLLKIFHRMTNSFCCKRLEEYLLAQQPDLVLTTHFLPNEVITHLKSRRGLRTVLVTCITDYYAHTWWRDRGVDRYITPNEDLTPRLVKLGVSLEQIVPLGIPVDPGFSVIQPKAIVRAKLGLLTDQFTLLVTSGGFGVGPVKDLLNELLKIKTALQILVICGNNSKLQDDLQPLAGHPGHAVRIFGFVRNIHELMDASDLMVSKSGGLTTTEAMAKGLPMVVLNPIPGQESSNCEFLIKHDAGLRAQNPQEAAGQIEKLVADPARLQNLRANIAQLGRPHSAREIVNYVRTLIK